MLFIFIFSYIPMDGVLMAFQDFFASLLGWIQTFDHVFPFTNIFNQTKINCPIAKLFLMRNNNY